jgi:hypothetical protein
MALGDEIANKNGCPKCSERLVVVKGVAEYCVNSVGETPIATTN